MLEGYSGATANDKCFDDSVYQKYQNRIIYDWRV